MARKSKHEQKYREMYDAGLSCSEIARQCGVSPSAVAQWLRGRNLPVILESGNKPDSYRIVLTDAVKTKPVPGITGYLAGSDGHIYSTRTNPPTALYGKQRKGGIRVRLPLKGKFVDCYVHVLIARAWLPERPVGGKIVFVDGDPTNCHPDNLVWGFGNSVMDLRAFVTAWQKAVTIAELCEEMAINHEDAYRVSRLLRSKGVPLKKLSGRSVIDFDELAELAADLMPEEE